MAAAQCLIPSLLPIWEALMVQGFFLLHYVTCAINNNISV